MAKEIFRLLIYSAENSFIQVTVFVGAVLLLFGYVNFKQSGNLVKKIEQSKRAQPIIGALLGLTPGCGGAIFIVPLFPKGTVSFGTIVATLIATMGDSAFVLMIAMPLQYLLVSLLSFIVAIITGYIIDYFDFGKGLLEKINKRRASKEDIKSRHRRKDHSLQGKILTGMGHDSDHIAHIGHKEGDEIDLILHHNIRGHQPIDTIGYKLTHNVYMIYWIAISIGLILGILDLFQVDLNAMIIPNLGTIVGSLGTLLSIIMMIASNKFIQSDTHEETELKTLFLKETIVHNAQETAFVATWVFIAYFVYELSVLGLGLGDYMAGEAVIMEFLSQTGLTSVLLGALIGIIPGCGPQIIFVTLYTRGVLPFSALLANAISQDGDALFPLIALDKRSAAWSTVFNTIAALVVGIFAYFIEVNLFP
ncbi:MAG: arsenic efflux protein [Tissierellia bacterium]|nr:arsenic efflux protein [Tissierellia bacterium]